MTPAGLLKLSCQVCDRQVCLHSFTVLITHTYPGGGIAQG